MKVTRNSTPLQAEPLAAPPLPRRERVPLVPERSDFLEGDEPAAAKVEAFLAKALPAIAASPESTAHTLVPWICDALLSNHSIKAYGRDFPGRCGSWQAPATAGAAPARTT